MANTPYEDGAGGMERRFDDWGIVVSDETNKHPSRLVYDVPELSRMIRSYMFTPKSLQHDMRVAVINHIQRMRDLHIFIGSAWADRHSRMHQWEWGHHALNMQSDIQDCVRLGYPVDTYPEVYDDTVSLYVTEVVNFRTTIQRIIKTMQKAKCFDPAYVHTLFTEIIPTAYWSLMQQQHATSAERIAEINVGMVFGFDIVASALVEYRPSNGRARLLDRQCLNAPTFYGIWKLLANNKCANTEITKLRGEIDGPWNEGFNPKWWSSPVYNDYTGLQLGTSASWCAAITERNKVSSKWRNS